MQNEGDYQVIITHEGVLVFLIKSRPDTPIKPFILYDGGRHATLYRSENETILLDYLNDKVIPILSESQTAVVFELSDEIEDVSLDYEVPVRHIKKNTFAQNAGDDLLKK
ncbi:MAG: hypothetical protein IJ019_06035 [Alphaproteobacteria bacterium]|nr:hypothetical protein [Alphaproteobacteria bacterium]